MADLAAEKAKLDTYEKEMGIYQDPNLSSNIDKYVKESYTPVMQSASNSLKNQMSDYLPRYFNITNQGLAAGTDAASLTPQQKLALATGEMGLMAGNLAGSESLMNMLGGSLNKMRETARGFKTDAERSAESKYNRQFQLYQLAFQEDEARKAREAQERLARMARSGGGGGGVRVQAPQFGPQGAPGYVASALQSGNAQQLYNAMKQWEKEAGGYNPQMHEQGWHVWRDWNYGKGAGAAGQKAIDSGQWKK